MQSKNPIILGCIYIFITILFLLLIEGGCFLYNLCANNNIPPITETRSVDFIKDDQTGLGFKPNNETQVTVSKKSGNELIYTATYTFDKLGRRIVPNKSKFNIGKFAMFVGDSNTFGEGLNDNQTLPYFFSLKNPALKVYNYAFSGYGINNVLALFESNRLKTEIPETKGIIIFPYYNIFIDRLVGSSSVFGWSLGRHPFYEFDDAGHLIHKKTFAESQPLFTKIMIWISNLNFFKTFDLDIKNRSLNYSIKMACQAFKQINENIVSQKPDATFVVVFGIRNTDPVYYKHFKECFIKNNIKFIDIRNLQLKMPKIRELHARDTHWNAEMNKFLGATLSKLLLNEVY